MKFSSTPFKFSLKIFQNYSKNVSYNPNLSQLVTFAPNKKLGRHRWFPYKESFSHELVEFLLKKLKMKSGKDVILDPFCGIGTTLLTSKLLGYDSVGSDILPLCTFITKTKLKNYDLKKIKPILLNIKGRPKNKPEKLDRYYINKSFDSDTISKLLNLRQEINEISYTPAKNLAKLVLLSILQPVSNTRRDGGFLRYNKQPNTKPIVASWNEKMSTILDDIKNSDPLKTNVSKIFNADARTCNFEKKISGVITSPPYLNRYDYTRIYALELTFDFVNDEELKKIRYNTIKSHIESKSSNKKAPSKSLESSLEKLSKQKLSNPLIPEMILGYYADLYATIKNTMKYTKPNTKLAFVLSSSRFSGVHFEADIILTELSENLGLKLDEIIVTKLRGSSAQQARTYGDIPLRESIVILKN